MTSKATDQRPPYFIIEDAVVEEYDLGPYAGWLYVVLCKHINRKTNDAFPGMPTIAKLAGMSEASVIRYLKILETKGLITVTRDINQETRERKPNHYALVPATKGGVVAHSNQGGVSEQPVLVADSKYNHKDSLSSIEDKGGGVPKAPKKPPTRSPVFITLARESFNIFDVAGLGKDGVCRINKLERWLKDNSPGATVATLMEFYKWYDKTVKASRPRDVTVFGERFTEFKQQHLAKQQTQVSGAVAEAARIRALKMAEEKANNERIKALAQQNLQGQAS